MRAFWNAVRSSGCIHRGLVESWLANKNKKPDEAAPNAASHTVSCRPVAMRAGLPWTQLRGL